MKGNGVGLLGLVIIALALVAAYAFATGRLQATWDALRGVSATPASSSGSGNAPASPTTTPPTSILDPYGIGTINVSAAAGPTNNPATYYNSVAAYESQNTAFPHLPAALVVPMPQSAPAQEQRLATTAGIYSATGATLSPVLRIAA
jgi:hypothetical protein